MAETRRVLVVDDEPSDNEFLTLTVRGLGFKAESAFDGQQALDMAGANRPDLVLLDALLPKVDGFAVLKELRRLHPDLPVVMLSGIYRKRTYEAEAIGTLGASAYLLKPLSVLQLWEVVERLLGSPGEGTASDFPGVPFWRRPLAATVADLHAARRTGLLFVRGTGGSSILFLEDGELVFARSSDPQARLDRVLQAMGRLDDAGVQRAAELLRTAPAGSRLGDLLVSAGMITVPELQEALSRQQQAHLTRPFTWAEGACHFFPTELVRRESFKMRVELAPILAWACRHLVVDDHLVRWLPRGDRKPTLKAQCQPLLARIGLTAPEAQLVALVDGTRTISQLRSLGRLLQVDAERLLATLLVLDAVELGSSPTDGAMMSQPQGTSFAVPVAGDVARYPPALLLVTLALARKTGIATFETTVAGTRATRTVYVQSGLVAFATSSEPQDRLGQVLVGAGLVSQETLAAALEAASQRPGTVLGRILVDAGAVTPDDLQRGLVCQVQQVVTGLLAWSDGTFQFQEKDLPARDVVPLDLDTRHVLLEAFRTCSFDQVARRLPPPETRLRRTGACSELASDLPLNALEDRILLEADGRRSLQQLAASAPEGPEALLRATHALMSLGLVEGFLAPKEAAAPSQAAPPRAAQPAREPTVAAAATSALIAGMDLDEEPFAADQCLDGGLLAVPLDGGASFGDVEAATPVTTSAASGSMTSFADDFGAPAPATERQPAASAVAVAEAPRLDGTAAEREALERFLLALSERVSAGVALVPDAVTDLLPPHLKDRFGF